MDAMLANSVLPALHIAIHPAIMPIHSHMLGICKAGYHETWTNKGTRPGNMANTEMQSMGRKRV